MYTDKCASHEYLCALIQKDTNIVNYLSKDLKESCFEITFGKKIGRKLVKTNTVLFARVYTDTG